MRNAKSSLCWEHKLTLYFSSKNPQNQNCNLNLIYFEWLFRIMFAKTFLLIVSDSHQGLLPSDLQLVSQMMHFEAPDSEKGEKKLSIYANNTFYTIVKSSDVKNKL